LRPNVLRRMTLKLFRRDSSSYEWLTKKRFHLLTYLIHTQTAKQGNTVMFICFIGVQHKWTIRHSVLVCPRRDNA